MSDRQQRGMGWDYQPTLLCPKCGMPDVREVVRYHGGIERWCIDCGQVQGHPYDVPPAATSH